MTAFMGSQCPERGPGLSHIINGVPPCPCIHCGEVVGRERPADQPPVEKIWPTVFDHRYVPGALTNRCLHRNCRLTGDAHAPMKASVEEGTCPIDHRGLRPFAECGLCHDVVEPRLATGHVNGPEYVKGTSDWRMSEVRKLKAGFDAGYWQS